MVPSVYGCWRNDTREQTACGGRDGQRGSDTVVNEAGEDNSCLSNVMPPRRRAILAAGATVAVIVCCALVVTPLLPDTTLVLDTPTAAASPAVSSASSVGDNPFSFEARKHPQRTLHEDSNHSHSKTTLFFNNSHTTTYHARDGGESARDIYAGEPIHLHDAVFMIAPHPFKEEDEWVNTKPVTPISRISVLPSTPPPQPSPLSSRVGRQQSPDEQSKREVNDSPQRKYEIANSSSSHAFTTTPKVQIQLGEEAKRERGDVVRGWNSDGVETTVATQRRRLAGKEAQRGRVARQVTAVSGVEPRGKMILEKGGGFGGGMDDDADDYPAPCSSLKVTGLERCPELEGDFLPRMLNVKRDMLREVIKVLTDPASPGVGGNPNEPLLLVQKLALDETDAIFGAFESSYRRHATDAGGWSPEPGGFNRWLDTYHHAVLRKTRPVIVTVHGDDVCALELEISREARMAAAEAAGESTGHTNTDGPGGGENFDVPLVLVTLGWDPSGDPTHAEPALGRDSSCVRRVLQLPRVLKWFTSHTRYDSEVNEKFKYIPIGFGGYETRNGLPQTAYLDAAKKQLEILETCPLDQAGNLDLLFQGNTLERNPRAKIWHEMTEKDSGPIPVNRAPLDAPDMLQAYARGIFAVSPPGTGADCFRHYELMLMGAITFVQDRDPLRSMMGDLPVFFFDDRVGTEKWYKLTCMKLKNMSKMAEERIKEGKNGGKGFEFEKLTHNYWRKYIREETLKAGGSPPTAMYTERSIAPINTPGWRTFRRLGCFSRKHFERHNIPDSRKSELQEEERTPEGCARKCSWKAGGGIGFFGIKSGNRCWCDKEPGALVPQEQCNVPCQGEGDDADSCGGSEASTVYVFGPEEPLPFEYVGCFYESHRVLYHVDVKLRHANTPFMCEALCTSLRYPFFALQKSSWCRCGVLTYNTPRSVRDPAFVEEFQPKERSPPDMMMAGKPLPGVKVGDQRFQCHRGRCAGDPAMWGCGSMTAFDVYKVSSPCSLYHDCADA